MITASQAEVVAYMLPDGGEILCRECAISATDQHTVEYADNGTSALLDPIIRYTLDTIIGENAAEHAYEVAGPYPSSVAHMSQAEEAIADAWQAAYDAYPDTYPCDSCGAEID